MSTPMPPAIAVLSLTRDRLDYTKHCFATLHHNAGCDFDHYVLDQASTDGTREWLANEYDCAGYYLMDENIGVCRGINRLIDIAIETADYDMFVKFDNDCEVVTPDTLAEVCRVADEWDLLLSPHIGGLRNPPRAYAQAECDGSTVSVTPVIGGIFMAVPGYVFEDGYRHDEDNPVWGGDDTSLCGWWQGKGKHVGYLDGFRAEHYRSTNGQHADHGWYFDRRIREGGPA